MRLNESLKQYTMSRHLHKFTRFFALLHLSSYLHYAQRKGFKEH